MECAKEKIKRILILRSDGTGDFILSLPAMNALRTSYPDARIVLFTANWQEEIARSSRLFDEIIVWDNSGNYYLTSPTKFRYLSYRMLKYIPKLKSYRFDLGIDFKDDLRNRFLLRVAGVTLRLGLKYKDGVHKSVLFQNLVKPLIAKDVIGPYRFTIPREDMQEAEKFLSQEGVLAGDKIIIVHPVGRWPAKTWPKIKFARLSEQLSSCLKIKLIFVGAREDLTSINEISKMLQEKPIIAAGKLNFLATAALIQHACLFVGNDAAPMQLAGILNIPTIALFGPTDPKVSGPQGVKSTIIRKITTRCPDCFKKNPGQCIYPDDFCMDRISVDEVFAACMRYLKEH